MKELTHIADQPEISVVIPAYNECDGIGHSLFVVAECVANSGVRDFELIVVDDGSGDNTFEEVTKIRQALPQVKAVRLSRNFGKESALLAGLEISSGRAVITIDSDLQHPPQLIPEMIIKWRQGCQIVHAVKRNRSNDGWVKRSRSRLFNAIFSKLGGIPLQDSSDYKLLERKVVDILVHKLKERERFYRGLSEWVGFNQEKIFFDVANREVGKSKWSVFALIELALTATVSFTTAPLRIVTFLGMFTLIFGIMVLTDTLWSYTRGTAVSGFATLEITLLLIGSFIMISLGIVGEYIGKIYTEAKARPLYIIADANGIETCRPLPKYGRTIQDDPSNKQRSFKIV